MSKIIANSKIIGKKEYIIYGADAEMVCVVLRSRMLDILLEGEMKKDEIENLVYKSLSAQEKTSYSAASEISIKILKKAIGINVRTLYDQLKDYENRGEFYYLYREHVVHQWRVFLLGLYLIDTIPTIKKNLEAEFKNNILKIWAGAALCHDIGYLIEKGNITENEYANDIIQLLNDLEDDGFSVFCPELKMDNILPAKKEKMMRIADIHVFPLTDWKHLFFDRDDIKKWKLENMDNSTMFFQTYYEITTELQTIDGNRAPFVDHGIASAAILFHLFERKQYWVEKTCKLDEYKDKKDKIQELNLEIRMQLCRAIALHNIRPDEWEQNKIYDKYDIELNEFIIDWKKEPLAYLLVLCDSLQEWARPSKDFRNRLRNEMISQDMHILVKNNKIYLCFPTDDLALSVSKESSYNQIMQPIKRLLNCDECIEFTEIEDDDMGKYLDEDLLHDEYKKIYTGSKEMDAYALYKQGRNYGNMTKWNEGKQFHIDAAKLFKEIGKNDWAARSLGRAAFDTLDLQQLLETEQLLEEAMELEPWQGTANYYWVLEHCVRKEENFEHMMKYLQNMLKGMEKLKIIDKTWIDNFEKSDEEEKFCALWDKLILLFTTLLQMERGWPDWSKSDQPRQYVLLAERNIHESIGYLKLAEEEYRKVKLDSYAAWTKSKRLFLEIENCKGIKQIAQQLKQIVEEEKKILQTPGGSKDIVRFTLKVNSFYYNVLMYEQFKDEKYKSEAKIYFSAIDSFAVSEKYEYKEQCRTILNHINDNSINVEKMLDTIKDYVKELAWVEKNKMRVLLR